MIALLSSCYSGHHLPFTSPSPLPYLPLTSPLPPPHLPQVLQVHKDEVSIKRRGGGGPTADIKIEELELIGTWNNFITVLENTTDLA